MAAGGRFVGFSRRVFVLWRLEIVYYTPRHYKHVGSLTRFCVDGVVVFGGLEESMTIGRSEVDVDVVVELEVVAGVANAGVRV